MNAEDRRGIEMLRAAVETVATDLERRSPSRAGGVTPRRVLVGALGVAAAAAALVAVLRHAGPQPSREVEILELRIQGRPVRAVVVDDAASGTLVVMPQVPGPPRAAVRTPGGRS